MARASRIKFARYVSYAANQRGHELMLLGRSGICFPILFTCVALLYCVVWLSQKGYMETQLKVTQGKKDEI